jgi:hypothetical protein
MERERLVKELRQIYGSEELERIEQVVSQIPDRVLDHLCGITKARNGPAPGHCIYHEIPEIADVAKNEYRDDIGLPELIDEASVETGAAEFCANAYQLYKTRTVSTGDGPERYQGLADKLRERGF